MRRTGKFFAPLFFFLSSGCTSGTQQLKLDFPASEGIVNTRNHFEHVRTHVRGNWDYFDKQFSLVKHIKFSEKIENFAEVDCPGTITFRGIDRFTLIHELAHIRYCNLNQKEKFKRRWEEINGNRYLGKDYNKATLDELALTGSASRYSLRDFLENVAETVEFVYTLNDPTYKINGFPNRKPSFRLNGIEGTTTFSIESQDIIYDKEKANVFTSKLVRKIGLLQSYHFFSEREATHAIEELNELAKNVPIYR